MGKGRFSDNTEFARLIESKKQDILRRTDDGIQDTRQFQQLLSLLSESRRKNEEQDYRLVLISKTDLLSLCNDADARVIDLFHSTDFLTNRTVQVDAGLGIISRNNQPFPADNNEARRYFTSLSADGGDYVVFLIAPNATVNYFIDGVDYGNGVFYTLEAQRRYQERKSIEQLESVLNDYRVSLTYQDTYLKFFVTKAGLRALHAALKSAEDEDTFVKSHKHLLNNSPEELFREDMRQYIMQHMRVVVSREVMLEDLDRLDIKLTDEMGSDLYFIEVKWVGESINNSGQKIGTAYHASPRINPDAVRQVVGYIDQLLEQKENVKIGYLAVFDARKDDMEDTGKDITESVLPDGHRSNYHRFVKLPDFRVKNINPR